ncbi:MAG: VOC family protein [Acidimicrobiia bacterium]|nr:VOC family protein [Acidimicrobiia bacterium]
MPEIPVVFSVMLDCNDLDKTAAFWTSLLGLEVKERFPGFVFLSRMGGQGPGLALQLVPEPKLGKNRMHLDLVAADTEALIARVLELGGSRLADRESDGFHWTVVADPEGNEFCIAPKG